MVNRSRSAMVVWLACALLFVSTATVLSQTSGPTQFIGPGGNGHWYLSVSKPSNMSWAECRSVAASYGGYLATVHSDAENAFILSMVGVSGHVLLGAYENPEGIWNWVSGELWTYSHWNSGEPNNGGGGEVEDYIELYASGPSVGYWNDCPPVVNGTTWFIVEFDQDPGENLQSFCDNFDYPTWTDNWRSVCGTQSPYDVNPHSGTTAIHMYGVPGDPGSMMYRKDFLASTGVYSTWFRQDWAHAEPRLYVMIDPSDVTKELVYRQGYMVAFSAVGSQLGGQIRVFKTGTSDETPLTTAPADFPMGQWVQGYIKIEPCGKITAGYVWSDGHGEVSCVDDSPIDRSGLFVLFTAAEQEDPSNVFDDVCFEPIQNHPCGIVPVFVDIKPGSCPNPLNIRNVTETYDGGELNPNTGAGPNARLTPFETKPEKSILPVAILGTTDLDVTQIDPTTIKLVGISPVRWSLEDVATPVTESGNCACNTLGPDGFTDLAVKFYAEDVAKAIGSVKVGDYITVTLIGKLKNGADFAGSDCVLMVGSKAATTVLVPTNLANYPNPFNPSTTISFSLPTASDYTLIIYNVMGQAIEEFIGHSEPGTVSLAWDGSRVASGVYFYRLTAGEFTETKKMMLLK
ncbi:hypothetical protein C3F09_03200 [candidate division GN15 bacterium]|uniref:C-type lectin domain-containing protein n=1 Tax=candidate division GN15 bacterium TaxID=2072418 RepID=A0A855X354_9BACT|nr:MAG: hypothetical protein C3F09_03200 [candidate division GN15 bacterium]